MNKFTVVALKEILSARGLSSSGSKAELITRIMEADPSGAWMNIDQSSGNIDQESENIDTEDSQQAGTSNAQPTTNLQQREINLYKKEKELVE